MSILSRHTEMHAHFVALTPNLMLANALPSEMLPAEFREQGVEVIRETLSEILSHETDPEYVWDGSDPESEQRDCEDRMREILADTLAILEPENSEPSDEEWEAFLSALFSEDREDFDPEDYEDPEDYL